MNYLDPGQYTQIPFKAKIMKILLRELEQSRTRPALEEETDDGGDSEEDGGWEDEDEGIKGAIDLSSMLLLH